MPESFLRKTEWTLTAVSPVHIGSGDRMSPLDYAVMTMNGKRLLVVYDFAALGITDAAKLEQLVRFVQGGPEWESLTARARELGASDPEGAIRYMAPMRASGKAEEIVPTVRDAEDRAYVPGSSLKGAIRTALLYAWCLRNGGAMQELVTGVLNNERLPRAEFAGQDLERRAFGRDPNHDAMRALRVGDSEPVAGQGRLRRLEAVLRAARIGSSGQEALRQCIETLMPGAAVRVRITLDTHLFTPQAEPVLHFGAWRQAIENWPAACREFSADLLEAQAALLERLNDAGAEWCRQLMAQAKHDQTGCLLPVGWGVGWEGKTVGMLMTNDAYADVKAAFTVAKGKRDPEQYIDGVFPATRWGCLSDKGNLPLGWARLTPAA